MTEDTKQLFQAPLEVYRPVIGLDYEVRNNRNTVVAISSTRDMAERIALLPELYDKLLIASRVYCPYASLDCTAEEECPHITIRTGMAKYCAALPWLRLLKRVRDGV